MAMSHSSNERKEKCNIFKWEQENSELFQDEAGFVSSI